MSVNEIRGKVVVKWTTAAADNTVQPRSEEVCSEVEEENGRAKAPSGMTEALMSVGQRMEGINR